ncbi:MAG: TonB-dependent receptor [Chitinophagaceae bacterium]
MMLRSMMLKGLPVLMLALSVMLHSSPVSAQATRVITGVVLDIQKVPLSDATVSVQNGPSTKTDKDGKFSLSIRSGPQTLVVSHVGKANKEIRVNSESSVTITLAEAVAELDNVVVIGYGQQKKASIIGAISQVSGKVLERTGGVTNLGQALTGNLPGVITTSSSGMPGAEDPQIVIRAQSSWNNSAPLVLVDGIERSMNSIDISSVENISILKDASATAVYGVKGANGVILITTKKGTSGRAVIQVRTNVTAKTPSKLPEKFDSYDGLAIKNRTLERELLLSANAWNLYTPVQILDKYRNPLDAAEWDRYPNVDWVDALFKDRAMSYNTAVNVSGGSQFVTYFAAIDYVKEGDLFRRFENGRGYESGYGYTRVNLRSNLDFNLTKTTTFSTKLFGSNGVRQVPFGAGDGDQSFWVSAYRTSPDAMRPIYSDGTWGFFKDRIADVPNSVYNLAVSGVEKRTNTQITTDFILQQKLDMVLTGLSFRGSLALDNTFREAGRGLNDQFNPAQRKWIDPTSGIVFLEQPLNPGTQLDFVDVVRWSNQAGSVDRGATYRRSNYILQLDYKRRFGKHDVTAMGLMQRERVATGSQFARYREDWVFRTTYNYASKYYVEANGAYNGSEQFGPDYRFAFFPSVSAGWMIGNENFMSKVDFLDMLKVRASWGKIGDDAVSVGRWPFRDQLTFGGAARMGSPTVASPYTFYRIASLGNPNIAWENVEKRNIGIEYSLFNGKIMGNVDVFSDNRTDIIIGGGSRAIPTYFGVAAPSVNLGRVTSKGFEIELKFNQSITKDLRVWINTNMTHATNKIIERDDPELRLSYQRQAGYALGQTRTYIDNGFLASWDDIYGSTQRSTNNQNKLPGDFNIIDFNGDGIIDGNDTAPYGYATTPQNTYNATIGVDWRGFTAFVQFYGVNNVTREVAFPTFHSSSNVAYVEGVYWTKGEGGEIPLPRWSNLEGGGGSGTRYQFDGSYVRLKNAEINYALPAGMIKRIGLKSCRVFVNGNNLLLWTKMPDDRESNFATGGNSTLGAYPTVKRFNLGVDITL